MERIFCQKNWCKVSSHSVVRYKFSLDYEFTPSLKEFHIDSWTGQMLHHKTHKLHNQKPGKSLHHNTHVWCNTNGVSCYATTHQYGATPTGSGARSHYLHTTQCRLGQLLCHNTHVWRNANQISCYVTMHFICYRQ